MSVMPISSITSKMVSVLGNPEALTPLLIQDSLMSYSLTRFAKKEGGDIERNDRFIDEFGTMAIWLGGIPFFKKIIDNTMYRAVKLSPQIDVRVVQNDAHREFAQKFATGDIKKNLEFAVKNKNLTKNMFYTKFGLATALSLASYVGLTKIRHYFTRKKSEQKVYKELAIKKFSRDLIQQNSKLKFSSLNQIEKNSSNKVSFGLTGRGVEAFMFDPALNTAIIDLGILSMRVGTSRPSNNSKHKVFTPERVEYLAKDGFLFFFYYLFARTMQPKIERVFEKFTKAPIGLDARALNSENIVKSFANEKQVQKDLQVFKSAKNDAEVLEFLQKNPDNIITKISKISDIVRRKGNTQEIDHGKYIKIDKIKSIASNVQKMSEKIKNSSGVSVESILKTSRNYKMLSILSGFGICIFSTGYIMPKLLYDVVRKKYNNGSKKFHVQERIEQDIKNELKKKANKEAVV